ncbi:hypothetical protein HanRHA438_Chr14g0664971 [Helianthus annuus]|nr:hypothetical protein HanRHA438_Chr14g0664971 [Helianthus annuus]
MVPDRYRTGTENVKSRYRIGTEKVPGWVNSVPVPVRYQFSTGSVPVRSSLIYSLINMINDLRERGEIALNGTAGTELPRVFIDAS